MKVAAIIPVAGSGKRFPGLTPKQFLQISGQAVVAITISSILSVRQINSVVVVCARETREQLDSITRTIKDFSKRGMTVEGGKERQDSVYNGLNVLDADTDIVLVHDGVRPLISGQILENSIQVAYRDGACIAAVPVKDTIKRVKDTRVLETLNRDELWQIQTPQTARYDWLIKAHQTAKEQNYYTTDEAALLEWQGYPVNVIPGDYKNIKITTPEDLKIAQIFFTENLH
jgi:2-C-methyl-D-erythritol 4-phosphate cytidylyltransferase